MNTTSSASKKFPAHLFQTNFHAVNPFFQKIFLLLIAALFLTSCGTETKKSFWENGNLKSSLSYKDGQLNGTSTWYYENGNKEQEVSYSNNKINGVQRRWYQNGKLESESTYVEGLLQGQSLMFDQEGNKIIEENYVNDTLHGAYLKFYPENTMQIEGAYARGFYTGRWVYYDLYGKVVGIGNFEEGTGEQKAWWPNGNLKREIYYENNLKQGEEKWYNEDGKLEKINLYEKGVLQN